MTVHAVPLVRRLRLSYTGSRAGGWRPTRCDVDVKSVRLRPIIAPQLSDTSIADGGGGRVCAVSGRPALPRRSRSLPPRCDARPWSDMQTILARAVMRDTADHGDARDVDDMMSLPSEHVSGSVAASASLPAASAAAAEATEAVAEATTPPSVSHFTPLLSLVCPHCCESFRFTQHAEMHARSHLLSVGEAGCTCRHGCRGLFKNAQARRNHEGRVHKSAECSERSEAKRGSCDVHS
jgi:hypothetical protein